MVFYPDGADYAGPEPVPLSNGIAGHDAGVAGPTELPAALRCRYANSASNAYLRLRLERSVEWEATVPLVAEGGGGQLDPGPLVAQGFPLQVHCDSYRWTDGNLFACMSLQLSSQHTAVTSGPCPPNDHLV